MKYLSFIILASCLTVAPGLRFPTEGDGVQYAKISGVPKNMDAVWREHLLSENVSEAGIPTNPDVRLLIGIFSMLGDRKSREVHRKTWMKHPGVCNAVHGPSARCSVYVSFVIGRPKGGDTSLPLQVEEDVLTLDMEENMNEGKSFKYFQTASRLYPWATHVGKMDLDVYPFASRLIDGIALDSKPQCFHYIGHCCNGRKGNEFHPHDFKAAFTNTCCTYLQGGFYIMSRTLAETISKDGDYWSTHSHGFEDKMSGEAIQNYLKQNADSCVSTWDVENSFVHHSTKSS